MQLSSFIIRRKTAIRAKNLPILLAASSAAYFFLPARARDHVDDDHAEGVDLVLAVAPE